MIEQGIVLLVQGDPSVSSIAAIGGFLAQLPKDQALPSWTYLPLADKQDYTLDRPTPVGNFRLQIDCYGYTAADCMLLGNAIDAILSGFAGTLSDPDSTVVQGCFRTNGIYYFDEVSRTFRRMIEYDIRFERN